MVKALTGAKVWDGNGWTSVVDDPDLPQPYPPKTDSYKDPNATIFIGVSAFRDKRCGGTLYNYFSKAKFPRRLRVGVVQQIEKEDPDCVDTYCDLMKADSRFQGQGACPFRDQIKTIRVESKLAAGPCYGRHMQSYMLRDEEFCMQTDSHMDVVPEWDVEMGLMWARTKNEYGVLSTYVHVKESIKSLEEAKDSSKLVPHLCQVSFTGGHNPRYVQAKLARLAGKPKLTTTWAAGFSFAKCHAWRATPYDPGLKMVFDGEEFSMAARLWTRGYDFYTPDFSLIGHDYNRPKDGPAPGSWVGNPGLVEAGQRGHKRLHTLLHINGESDPGVKAAIGKYGLGDKRSFEQYQVFVGANTTTMEILTNRCNSIAWVPFEEQWPPTENNLGGPYWEHVFKAQEQAQRKQALAAASKAQDSAEQQILPDAGTNSGASGGLAPPNPLGAALHYEQAGGAAAAAAAGGVQARTAGLAGAIAEMSDAAKLLMVLALTAVIIGGMALASGRRRGRRSPVHAVAVPMVAHAEDGMA